MSDINSLVYQHLQEDESMFISGAKALAHHVSNGIDTLGQKLKQVQHWNTSRNEFNIPHKPGLTHDQLAQHFQNRPVFRR